MIKPGTEVETTQYIEQLRLSKFTRCRIRSELGKGDVSVVLPNGKITVLHEGEYRAYGGSDYGRVGH